MQYVFNLIVDIPVMDNWQLSKKGIQWPVAHDCIAVSSVQFIEVTCFLKVSADHLLVWTNHRLNYKKLFKKKKL